MIIHCLSLKSKMNYCSRFYPIAINASIFSILEPVFVHKLMHPHCAITCIVGILRETFLPNFLVILITSSFHF